MKRRDLFKAVGGGFATLGLPTIIPGPALGMNGATPAGERLGVAMLGCGVRSGSFKPKLVGDAKLSGVELIIACDPIKQRAERFHKLCAQHYREALDRADVDAVIVASTAQWHVPLAAAAIRAGKDVYCEKPLGLDMEDHKYLRALARQRGAIFQYGTQTRSHRDGARAAELVRNGYIGEVREVHVTVMNGVAGGDPRTSEVPPGIDYDLWLGPAPWKPFCNHRVLHRWPGGTFCVYDNTLGLIADWGAHSLDLAHWAYPHIPVTYQGKGVIPTQGLYDVVIDWDVRGTYASGASFSLKAGPPWRGLARIVGTEGEITAITGGGIRTTPKSLASVEPKAGELHLYRGRDHFDDFIACVRSRKPAIADLDSAVQSDFVSHLGDIAIRVGRQIRWDPVAETIVGDEQARRMMSRPARAPYGTYMV